MSATTDLVDAMSDDLSPVEEEKVEEKEVEQDEKVKEIEKKEEDKEEAEDDDEGYVIDDEEEEKPEVKEDKPVEPAKPSNLNSEQQFIYDNLPTISIQGKDGKRYDIKVPAELPEDFEFANTRESANFYSAIASQELKANQLQSKFQSDASAKSAEEFSTKEDRAITEDIAELQRTGELPKFKKQPSDPDFDSDPTAQTVSEVVDFMNKRNAEYLKRSEAGQAYRHIGFEEAFYAFRRANPEKTRSTEQQAEDNQRKNISRNVSSKGTKTEDTKRPMVRSGMQTRDLYSMIDSLDD